ncbi:MAG: hypothetical protein R3C28_10835 [Pirellulaceae bacterium]
MIRIPVQMGGSTMIYRIWQLRYSFLTAALLFICGVWWSTDSPHAGPTDN